MTFSSARAALGGRLGVSWEQGVQPRVPGPMLPEPQQQPQKKQEPKKLQKKKQKKKQPQPQLEAPIKKKRLTSHLARHVSAFDSRRARGGRSPRN